MCLFSLVLSHPAASGLGCRLSVDLAGAMHLHSAVIKYYLDSRFSVLIVFSRGSVLIVSSRSSVLIGLSRISVLML